MGRIKDMLQNSFEHVKKYLGEKGTKLTMIMKSAEKSMKKMKTSNKIFEQVFKNLRKEN